jgi:hypothetical protein
MVEQIDKARVNMEGIADAPLQISPLLPFTYTLHRWCCSPSFDMDEQCQ